jgi:uncharacterized protein (DUF1501 family)
MSTRREFLAQGTAAATLLATGATLPSFLTRTAHAAVGQHADSILVVVQMTGGNDGLNTVVPFRDDAYHQARPTLRVQPKQVLKLNDEVGLHPEMAGMKRLFDDGLLQVLSNVGYPNPNRSHFRSMDIWHTANTTPEQARDGWLGRIVAQSSAGRTTPFALHLDSQVLPLALKSQGSVVPSIANIEAFTVQGDADELEQAIALPRAGASADLMFVQRATVAACANARRINNIKRPDQGAATYPDYRLAGHLRQIANLIDADFGPRIYYTSIGGFDTHALQAATHSRLLRELSTSVTAFFADLGRRKLAERVILMTFSEFGRRVAENGSRGTDHGVAAPMFLVGPACQAGVQGGLPDLSNLIDGDIRHSIDFRQVYASLTEDWLGIKHQPILGRRYEPINILRKKGTD